MPYVRDSLLGHIADKFTVGDGCWEWTGQMNDAGYGIARKRRAHRVIYELLVGPIAPGLQLDHLCRNRCCVRPDHLEPVTQAENLRRGDNNNRKKTSCPRGHPYDELIRNGKYMARRCSICRKERLRCH